MAFNRDKRAQAEQQDELDEHTVFINRCAKTVKGGRRMSFSAVIVVGDKDGMKEKALKIADSLVSKWYGQIAGFIKKLLSPNHLPHILSV